MPRPSGPGPTPSQVEPLVVSHSISFFGKGGSMWLNHQQSLVFHEFSHPESFLDSGKGWSIMIKKAFRFLITGSTWLADFKCWRLAKKHVGVVLHIQLYECSLPRCFLHGWWELVDGCKMLQQLPGVIYPNDQLLSGNQTWQWKIPICRSFTQLQTSIYAGFSS